MIQDYIIAATQWGFLIALLPTLLHKTHKPAILSSLWTGALLLILSATFLSLSLINGALSSFAVAIVWFILAYQRFRLDRAGKR